MSAPTDIYVSPSTSLILIRNVSTPTNIYLNSFNASNFNVSIRDTTGSSNIQVSSVYVSTIGTARFADGSFLYTLNQPYGFVNLGFRNSSFWQVLHTSGQTPLNSAANVNSLNVSTSFVTLLSTVTANISSLLIENIRTTNAITITGPFVITNLSAPGIVTVQSSLNVYGDVDIEKQLFVSGATRFYSSLTVTDILPVSSVTRVLSSVGVASSLFVGGGITVGSTLFTQLTNIIQSLQIQKSSPDITTTVEDSVFLRGVLSSFLSLTVKNDYFGKDTSLTIYQNTSTLTFQTHSMDVGDTLFSKDDIVTNNVQFPSTVFLGSSLTLLGNAQISTGFMVGQNFAAPSIKTTVFSTLSSFSTGSLFLTSTLTVSSGLSTFFLDVLDRLSVGNSLHTVATVSSFTQTRVKDTVYVTKNAYFDILHFSSGISTDSIFVGGSISTSSSAFKNLSTLGTFITSQGVTVAEDINVFSNASITSNLNLTGNVLISSISAESYLLSSLYITTSSPAVSFRASSLIVSCNVDTKTVLINVSPILSEYSFASTTQFNKGIAETSLFNDVRTSNLFWGPPPSTNLSFSLNAESLFPRGLSAQTILANSLTADTLVGRFLGDGFGISNVALLNKNVSAITASASTFSSQQIFTSSMYTSSFQNRFLTTVVSSFQSPTLAIEGIGYPVQSNKNQILMLDKNVYTFNNTLYVDSRQNRLGINISSPKADLDISGGIYSGGGFIYSSIQEYYVSTLTSPLNLSSLVTGYAVIRDAFKVSSFLNLVSPNTFNINSFIDGISPFYRVGPKATYGNDIGIFSYGSSISLQSGLFIINDTKRVGFNSISTGIDFSIFPYVSTYTFSEPQYEFDIANTHDYGYLTISGTSYISSLNLVRALTTRTFTSPSLYIESRPTYSTNTLSTTLGTLFMNDSLLVLSNSVIPKIGIQTSNMVSEGNNSILDINGSAFFSSLLSPRLNVQETLSFSSRLL